MKKFDINKDGIEVRLRIGKFDGYRVSKQLKAEAAAKHKADVDSITGGVKLIKREDKSKIEGIADRARAAMYKWTWPWEEEGKRLCPSWNYASLTAELDQLEREFIDATSELVGRYDALVADAKTRLNGLSTTHKFPSRAAFAKAFSWRFTQDRVTNPRDIDFSGIDSSQQDKIKADLKDRIGDQLHEAQTDMIGRLTEIIAHVKEQLIGKNGKKDKKVTKALWKNLDEALEVLPSLNVFGDEKVQSLIDKARKQIAGVAVEDIRADKKIRKAVAGEADSILSDLANFGIGGGDK